MINSFWDNRFTNDLIRYKRGEKEVTKWKLLYTLILKYSFPMEVRGFGVKEIAIKIINFKDGFDKLTQEEKEFVSLCLSG